MNETSRLASRASAKDPAVGLRAVWALGRLHEQLEQVQVDNARDQGWTWQQIADGLATSRQNVHRKHGKRRAAEGKD